MIRDAILVLYALAGSAYWWWMAWGATRIWQRVVVLADIKPPEPARWPRLSVIVPACNEAATIEAAAATILAQDYPALEVVLVDDRSSDDTGARIERLAQTDARVIPVSIRQLPDGWLGKPHAMATAERLAAGEWLLFTDADVHFTRPDTLRRSVAWAMEGRLDHLAMAPETWSPNAMLEAIISLLLRSGCVAARIWKVEDPRSNAFIGIGAFNMVRREALARTPGLEWLRLEVVEDLGLGMMIKRWGGRSAIVQGAGLVGLTWYHSLADMASGVEKAYASVALCSLPRMAFIGAALLAFEMAPLVALAGWGLPGLRLAGAAMLALAVYSTIIIHRWARRRVLPTLLTPLAVVVSVGLTLRSAWLGWRRGGVLWRGTLYPSPLLRQGARVRLGRGW